MQIKFKLDGYAYMPTKAHAADAGFDLKARKGKLIRCMNSKVFDTGVHVEIPDGYVGYIQGRSGLNVNHEKIVRAVSDIQGAGNEVIVVTSAAISVGTAKMGLPERADKG